MVPGQQPLGLVRLDKTHPISQYHRLGVASNGFLDGVRSGIKYSVVAGEKTFIPIAANTTNSNRVLSASDRLLFLVRMGNDGVTWSWGDLLNQQLSTNPYTIDFIINPFSYGGIQIQYNGVDLIGGNYSYSYDGTWVAGWTGGTLFVYQQSTRTFTTASVAQKESLAGNVIGVSQDAQYGFYWANKNIVFIHAFAMPTDYSFDLVRNLADNPYQFLIPA
jgi:hypothetical protein